MAEDTNQDLQTLIERLRRGEADARRELIGRAYERLRRLAGAMFHRSFPALRDRHEVESVVHDACIRLVQALESVPTPTVADFFRLAAHKIHQVLLDMVERQRRLALREQQQVRDSSQDQPPEPSDYSHNPADLALWSEFHARVAALPPEERDVFELHHYLDLPQAEIATLLGLHPRKVSRLWIAATEHLAETLPGLADLP
jgi:RNA polymerase sigma factor (sigma-70 family)